MINCNLAKTVIKIIETQVLLFKPKIGPLS